MYIVFGLVNFTLLAPLFDILFNTGNTRVVNDLPGFSFSVSYFKDAFYYYMNYYIRTTGKGGVLVYVALVVMACVVLKNLFGFLSQKVLTRMRVNMVRNIRNELYQQYSHQ